MSILRLQIVGAARVGAEMLRIHTEVAAAPFILPAVCERQVNTGIGGNDLDLGDAGADNGRAVGHMDNYESCMEACALEPGCSGIAWVKAEASDVANCALKDLDFSWNSYRTNGNDLPFDGNCDSGEMTSECRSAILLLVTTTPPPFTLPAVCERQDATGVSGNDLQAGGLFGRVDGHMDNYESCMGACALEPGCSGIAWVKADATGDNCAVKHSLDWASQRDGSGALPFDRRCDSGEMTQDCRSAILQELFISTPACEVKFLTTYAGATFRNTTGVSLEECKILCAADKTSCLGVEYQPSEQKCMLKSEWSQTPTTVKSPVGQWSKSKNESSRHPITSLIVGGLGLGVPRPCGGREVSDEGLDRP
eukprot:g1716.t1